MTGTHFPGDIFFLPVSILAWILLWKTTGQFSIRAGCYNLAKLSTNSAVILTFLPEQTPFLINVVLATGLGFLVVLLAGHLRVRFFLWQKQTSKAALHAVQQGLRPDTTTLPSNYALFLLGSGGHTKEMCSMIQKQFPPSPNMHRRYVITSGDTYSASVLTQLEQSLKADLGAGKVGTYDCYMVKRSRRVHQKWYSAMWSTLESVKSLLCALTTRPQGRLRTMWQTPNVVVTNGPGTGFILCMLAHLLKVLCLAHEESLKIIYVESLARVKTLSLTGKLFHWTAIADVFLVQHPSLATRYGKINAGFMVETKPHVPPLSR